MEDAIDKKSKIDYLRKMVGKEVFVISDGYSDGYSGVITAVIDDEHFKIKPDKGEERIVDIFYVRSWGVEQNGNTN